MCMTRSQGREVRAAATQPEHLEAFYREHLPFVRSYVARRLDDPSDIADVTADIFLRVIKSAATYHAHLGPPRAWLTGIARNAVAEHRRVGGQYEAAIRQFAGRRWLDEESADRIVQRVAAQADARVLLRLISEIPVSLRVVVELVAVDGLSVAEAAAVLEISPGAARVRYHRARRLLRESSTSPQQTVTP
jgi:RNA polymerase sigma factor (sigma-70 family)